MAVLGAPAREAVSRFIMRWWSDGQESCAFTKPELAAAIAAADQWIEDNAASYNAALPAGFRAKSTPAHKALVLAYVTGKRGGMTLPKEG